ncbi:MAG: DUF502 domain-containing protein [Sedimentisphaerales bacterium]|nr:DUF502 domain-containing protein [Sedimentisphaerales bacterium]
MKRILQYFFRGLLITVPVGLTVLLLIYVFRGLDSLFGDLFRKITTIPGAGVALGLVLTLSIITIIGFIASNFLGRKLFNLIDKLFKRVPIVKMLYTSIKDLVEAFAGEEKKFDKPVLVNLGPGCHAKIIGFITRETLENFGLKDHVAVYFPQSYNFAGNVFIFPKEAVSPLDIPSSEAMTFIVSGGVAGK